MLQITFLFFMSLTTEGGRKSWKAFSVFFFSSSSSFTFSTTSLAKTLEYFLLWWPMWYDYIPDDREGILDKEVEADGHKADEGENGNTSNFLLVCCVQLLLFNLKFQLWFECFRTISSYGANRESFLGCQRFVNLKWIIEERLRYRYIHLAK